MTEFGLAFVVVLVVVGVLLVLFLSIARASDRKRAYRDLSRRFSGVLKTGGLFGRPSVRFKYGQSSCLINSIKTRSARGGVFTQVVMDWPDAKFRLMVFPSWRSQKLWSFSGMERFFVSDPEFVKRYHLRASDSELGRVFLSEGVRWQIERLRNFKNVDDIYVSITRGFLVVKKPGTMSEPQALVDLVHFCLELFDQAMLTRTVGIDFVQPDATQILEDIVCQICGESIELDMVFCVRCKTPHCRECWDYCGQCSTFACGETRYMAPSVANPITESIEEKD